MLSEAIARSWKKVLLVGGSASNVDWERTGNSFWCQRASMKERPSQPQRNVKMITPLVKAMSDINNLIWFGSPVNAHYQSAPIVMRDGTIEGKQRSVK